MLPGVNKLLGLPDSSAFTLIELMIVILVGIAVPVYLNIRCKTMDRTRMANMKILQEVLPRYCIDYGNFPTNTDNDYGGWDGDRDGVFINDLVTNHYDKQVVMDPSDPTGASYSSSGNMSYYRYPAGSYGADPLKGDFCVFGIRMMYQGGTARYTGSPGFSTPGRNWQGEFAWVDGFYQIK